MTDTEHTHVRTHTRCLRVCIHTYMYTYRAKLTYPRVLPWPTYIPLETCI